MRVRKWRKEANGRQEGKEKGKEEQEESRQMTGKETEGGEKKVGKGKKKK